MGEVVAVVVEAFVAVRRASGGENGWLCCFDLVFLSLLMLVAVVQANISVYQ